MRDCARPRSDENAKRLNLLSMQIKSPFLRSLFPLLLSFCLATEAVDAVVAAVVVLAENATRTTVSFQPYLRLEVGNRNRETPIRGASGWKRGEKRK